ncbi:hypothetical protein ACHHYP_13911 [Achlya hypogyna]|uniref:HTH CENPB-type domain-containing protein n=1 Tax=Achlya hypogyna TaxID=1202772 RepID=A0A1V9YEH4_ACHHY|nr:hypothetical protein ACHHYP_13911 [Achlya hypogyna]
MQRGKPNRPKSGAIAMGPSIRNSQPTLLDKINMLNYYHANDRNQSLTARWFQDHGFPNLSQSTISRVVRNEAKLRQRATDPLKLTVVRVRAVSNPAFDRALSMWVDGMESQNFTGLTGDVIRAVAGLVYDQLNVPLSERLRLSAGWLDKFKARNALRFFRFHGEAASVSPNDVCTERARMQCV